MRWIRLSLGVFLTGMSSLLAFAGATLIQEGAHYQVIPSVHAKPPSNRVEVIAFFSYGCPHCYHFDPVLQAWAKKSPMPIDLVLVPVTFRPGWEVYAQAYYAAELFNKLDSIHMDLFTTIHQGGQSLLEMRELMNFFAKHGIPPDQFMKTFNSFGVSVKVGSAVKMALDYRIHSVPTVVVNGKYLIHAGFTGSFEGTLAVLDYLIKKEVKGVKTVRGKR